MYLKPQQVDLYFNNFDKIKNTKVDRNGIIHKGLSVYAKREVNKLFELNEALGEENISGYAFKEDAVNELKKIESVISKHKRLKPLYEVLKESVESSLDEYIDDWVMPLIIRLEVALGVEVDLTYSAAINDAFDAVYFAMVNGKYSDQYTDQKVKRMIY